LERDSSDLDPRAVFDQVARQLNRFPAIDLGDYR